MKENSIEEDIKILEEFIDGLRQYNPKTGKDIKPTQFGEGQRYVYSNVYYTIDHILSDYKRVLKENEQLRTEVNSLLKENEELKIDNDIMKQDLNGNVLYVDELEENYILKDKIEKILDEAEITDFNSLVEMFLKINKLLESE